MDRAGPGGDAFALRELPCVSGNETIHKSTTVNRIRILLAVDIISQSPDVFHVLDWR